MKFSGLLFAGLASSAAATYIKTPVGFVLERCVHEHEHGTHLRELESGELLATRPDGSAYTVPVCERDGLSMILGGPAAPAPTADDDDLPSDYDGWLEYNAYNDPDGFDAMLGYMSVPDSPSQAPDVLYLFPGLQNIDWIPYVDPEPSEAFDIIQPVLANQGRGWSVASWYVTLKSGVQVSRSVSVDEGDAIWGNMTRTGDDEWYVGSTVKSSGKTTAITVSADRLESQPWAYGAVLECYGCDGCGTYPQEPVQFTELALYKGDTLVEDVAWENNPKPSPNRQCNEAIESVDSATATISFQ